MKNAKSCWAQQLSASILISLPFVKQNKKDNNS
jgi:hypothetical protein